MWLTPTDEELFQKYNPELQKRSLERRYERQKEFDDFVTKLKEYSKSDKPSVYRIANEILTAGLTNLRPKYGPYRPKRRRRGRGRLLSPRLLRWPRRSRPGGRL